MSQEMNVLAEIRERIVRMETKMDTMTDVRNIANEAHDRANDALHYSKSAHHRIDDVADNQKWLWRTVVAAIIGAGITFITKLKGGA